MNTKQKIRIHKIIEYIKHLDFDFDVHDVEDGIDNILQYYDIFQVFTDEEQVILKGELLAIADASQTGEMVRCLEDSEDPLLLSIRPFKMSPERAAVFWKVLDNIENEKESDRNRYALEVELEHGTA